MVTNYHRGARLEYRIKRMLETKGYLVLRSSGSHSPIDLFALPPVVGKERQRPWFIQCKKTIKDTDYLSGFRPLIDVAWKYDGKAVLVYSLRRTEMFAKYVDADNMTIRRTDANVKAEEFF